MGHRSHTSAFGKHFVPMNNQNPNPDKLVKPADLLFGLASLLSAIVTIQ